MIKSKDYHDYVIKDGKFIGAFEQMYQNVADPWHHGKADVESYDMVLYLVRRFVKNTASILDIGCGKGAFTARVKKELPKSKILGLDISETAIKKAKKSYAKKGIMFETADIQQSYKKLKGTFDLIILSNVMWYILPEFSTIVNHLKKNLKRGGHLVIRQTFYKPGQQKYGADIVASPEDMLKILKYQLVEIIELNRQTNHEAIVLLKKK